MQTTRRRRTTASLSNDGYDPKNKSNTNKQILFAVLGVAAGLFTLFLLFRLFSTSTPSTVSEGYVDLEEQANEGDAQRAFGSGSNQGGNMPNVFGNRDGRFSNPLDRVFPLRNKEKMYEEMRKKRENMVDDVRGRMPPNLDDMRQKLGKFGNLGNLRGSHFSEQGEGPIFNDLNNEQAGDTKSKLSPEQVQEMKAKMRPGHMNDMRAREFGFKDRSFFKPNRFRKGGGGAMHEI